MDDAGIVVERALYEDSLGIGDVTTLATVPKQLQASARFLAKEDGVVAGLRVCELVFQKVDPKLRVSWDIKDGTFVKKGMYFGSVSGRCQSILTSERIALNLMQRMSGVATLTRKMVEQTKPYRAKILDTRKTAPGLRQLDKLAVRLGGGTNHRMGLYDMAMIKDNHVSAAGGVTNAVAVCVKYLKSIGKYGQVPIELETQTLDEVRTAVALEGVDRIMLDNMVKFKEHGEVDTTMLSAALKIIEESGVQVETEASGNVTLHTVNKIASTGIQFISSGQLTHSVKAMDISLKINQMGSL